MKLGILIIGAFLSIHSQASTCGLPESFNSANYKIESSIQNLFEKNVFNYEENSQLLRVARNENKVKKTGMQIPLVEDAVLYLIEHSVRGEAVIFDAQSAGQDLTVVIYYPSSNAKPHGALFAYGEKVIKATITNGKVTCK